jgi:hypothetical protein
MWRALTAVLKLYVQNPISGILVVHQTYAHGKTRVNDGEQAENHHQQCRGR